VPSISVIVPLYNQVGRIEITLSDILSQTFKDVEIILVDDASTDGGAASAEKFLSNSSASWTLVRHPKNRGASEARNTGLDIASGKAVFFLDGDDRISPGTLALLWNRMRKSNSPLAFCGFKVCRENQESVKIYSYPLHDMESPVPTEKILFAFLRGKRYMNASNVLYNRSFLIAQKIRFPRGCRFAEDREFIVKALFHGEEVAIIPDALVSYVQHENQSTNRMAKDPAKYAHEVGVYLRLRKYLAERQADPKLLRLIDSLELPNAVIKMATSAVRSAREDLFWKVVHSRRLRELACRGLLAWSVKPEVAFKSMLFSHVPGLLLCLYRRNT